jgi:lipopolysaccharide export system protein LptA
LQKKIQYILSLLLLLFTGVLLAQSNLEKEKTKVDIQSGYLERTPELPDAFIYTKDTEGQVYIVHEGVKMWCNQAYVYLKDNFVKAYGEVKIKQGDTISMNSDYAEYNGNTQFAFASGTVVFKEPKTTLKTDTLYFDRVKQEAYYRSGGKVLDTASTLTSRIGRYYAKRKNYQFSSDVKIVNPKYTIYSQELNFYSETGAAFLYGPSTIVSDSSSVYCERGFYDTRGDTGYFVKNARVDYESRTLYGDSIFFDRNKSFASATNNIKVLDTANKSIIRGHYAEVFRQKDSVFITKRAVAITLQERDSVFIHADTLQITGKSENRVLKGFYKARFFKESSKPGEEPTSGKCDSIFVHQKKGITKLVHRPILWTGENQMTGDTIHLINNVKTEELDTLKVFNNAFLSQRDSLGYNQVKGERLIGLFTKNELDTVNIDKNAQVIYFARNDKNELIGINNTVSSSIQMYMEHQEIQGIRFVNKGTGKIYPVSKLPVEARILPGFEWRGKERLLNKEDLFKGKPNPVLLKIKGIPLPENQDAFFEEKTEEELKLPSASKLNASVFKNRPEDNPSEKKEKQEGETDSEKRDN